MTRQSNETGSSHATWLVWHSGGSLFILELPT